MSNVLDHQVLVCLCGNWIYDMNSCFLFCSFFFQYTLSMVGYGDDEMKTTVLELTYNYGVTEYTKGNAYGQV